MKWRSVRWFTIEMREGGLPLREIAAQMLGEQYTARRPMGFALRSATESRIEGLFVHRREVEETVEDPLGRTFKNKRVVVRQFRFRLTKEYPQLEVVDAGAGFSAFFVRLVAMLNQRAIVEPVAVPPGDWLAAIEREVEATVTVGAVIIKAIPITESISARVVVQGEDDVREAARRLVTRGADHDPEFDRVVLTWPKGRGVVKCELGRRGARVERGAEDHARPALRKALSAIRAEQEREASPLIDLKQKQGAAGGRARRQTN